MYLIVDSNNPPRGIDEPHCHVLAESFHNYGYDCASEMMMVLFSFTFYHEGATYRTAAHNADGMNLLKEGYSAVILNGAYRCCFAVILRDEDGME